jgi:isoquinoline 1-oxidoreductase alpha subunit
MLRTCSDSASDMPTIKLNVNGRPQTVEVDDPSTPLLWVLRDVLGLTGTKYGCGIGQCGACTVHVDDIAVRSCSMPISAIGGKSVRTIEGLSPGGRHPLQLAWQAFDVPQCGYCQAGQIMNAAAFLAQNSKPSDEDITRAMSGNLCRCGTYPRIHAAIKHAAATTEPSAT